MNLDTLHSMIDDVTNVNETFGIEDNSQDLQFNIICTFTSLHNPEWRLAYSNIESIRIIQREDSYADEIILETQVPVKHYIEITRNSTNLNCTLSFSYTNVIHYDPDKMSVPIIKEYKVFIKNEQDLMMKHSYKKMVRTKENDETRDVPLTEGHMSSLIPIEFQLIEEKAYSIQKNMLCTIFKNATMEDVIKFIATKFSIPRLNLVKPDNTTKFRNLQINDENGQFDKIFNYLQNEYGVYKAGLSYYFTNGTLYIYPTNDMITKKDKLLRILNVEPDKYISDTRLFKFKSHDTGLNKYQELHLVDANSTNFESVNKMTSENVATTFALYKLNKMLEPADTSDVKNINIPEDNVQIFDSDDDGLIDSNHIKLKYIKPTKNIFKVSSSLIKMNIDRLNIEVKNMLPFTKEYGNPNPIIPGRLCEVIYESDESTTTRHGIVTDVEYIIVRAKRTTDDKHPYVTHMSMSVNSLSTKKTYNTKIVKSITE